MKRGKFVAKKNFFLYKLMLIPLIFLSILPFVCAHDPTPMVIMFFGTLIIAVLFSIVFIIIIFKYYAKRLNWVKTILLIILAIVVSVVLAIIVSFGLTWLYNWNENIQFNRVTNPSSLNDCSNSRDVNLCVMYYAVKQKDSDICLNIKDERNRDFCYKDYANRMQDREICFKIDTEIVRAGCFSDMTDFSYCNTLLEDERQNCIELLAMVGRSEKNLTLCKFAPSYDSCMVKAIKYYGPSTCNEIEEEIYRTQCLAEYEKRIS